LSQYFENYWFYSKSCELGEEKIKDDFFEFFKKNEKDFFVINFEIS